MHHRRAFTLIELVVVVAIIGLLGSILVPALGKTRDLAKKNICKKNQKAIAAALHMYAEDFDDQIPTNTLVISGFWSLSWAKRVGRLLDKPEGLPTSGYFQPPRSPGGKIFPEYKISVSGYIDFNWHLPTGGYFKCPEFWDQFEPKAQGMKHPLHNPPNYWDTMGLQFSMNGLISPNRAGSQNDEARGRITCMRFSDIARKTVLIGDCGARGFSPKAAMPTKSYFGFQTDWVDRDPTWIDYIIASRGPWPWITNLIVGSGGITAEVDFYGHKGGKTNLAFTDGHVKSIKRLTAELFTVD